jgi:hypothetical protein
VLSTEVVSVGLAISLILFQYLHFCAVKDTLIRSALDRVRAAVTLALAPFAFSDASGHAGYFHLLPLSPALMHSGAHAMTRKGPLHILPRHIGPPIELFQSRRIGTKVHVRDRRRQVMASAGDGRHRGSGEECTSSVKAQDATFASP